MSSGPACYGIIPARYASSRFPGKPLARIMGKPMIWHVYERAIQCRSLESVTVATDDGRIVDAAEALGIPVVMTRNDHVSGTDRVLEAAGKLRIPDNAVVVNIQGDEPALNPEMIETLIAPFADPALQVTTLGRRINAAAAEDPDTVKIVLGANQSALYFSRAAIPFPRDSRKDAGYIAHIGLYAFRMATLNRFVSLPPGRLEAVEKLEQLRLLENGIPIHVVMTSHMSRGVDRPDDIGKVTALLKSFTRQPPSAGN